MIAPLGAFQDWLLLLLLLTTRTANAEFISCSGPCNGGDVNYDLTASVRVMKMLNYTYKGRTYSSEGSDSFMGPTMRVRPGQSLWIKLINKMTEPLGPHEPNAEDYWKMLQNPGEHIKYQFYHRSVSDPSQMKVDVANVPKRFDATNLHLHGLDIAVHMFDPVGTHDPAAPHIAVDPGECYCYRFQVPHHHPSGLYWYHPHLHGSTAIQLWGGMLGVLYVEGPLEEELAEYGVSLTKEFVIWDPAFKSVQKATHNLEVDEFLLGQTTLSKIHPFLVNGQLTPDFNVGVGEVLHLRVLCGTIENENTFIVYPEGQEQEHWEDAAIPFWVIGSDGVTYKKPRQKNILVMAGGQREEIVLQFDEPGKYVISQQGIQGMQFFDMRGHPHDQILATISVDSLVRTQLPKVPISDMVFTPGYAEDESIQAEDITKTETIVFSMGANRDEAPFPQYYVNGKSFSPDRLDFFAHPGEAREYILINAQHNVHPFHIHVNRFQIKEMGSELSTTKYPVLKAVLDFDPDQWRDTVIVPPSGRTRIWVKYGNYTGKTIFHCHFLAHEDTGMMATLFIGQPDAKFDWKDHQQMLLGACVGILGTSVLLLVYLVTRREKNAYAPAEMNELKSKAMD
jgi:FtsP/CotA-like multicopper oxidase with cupredoxin domain